MRQNLGFESAGVAPNGRFLYTATENALVQDGPAATVAGGSPARIRIYKVSLPGHGGTATKELVLDLDDLGIPLDNVEGMTFGPRLPDGRRSIVLVSDDNFAATQFMQFLVFALDR